MGNGGMGDAGMMDGMMNMMGAMGGSGMGVWGLLTKFVFWVAFILLIGDSPSLLDVSMS